MYGTSTSLNAEAVHEEHEEKQESQNDDNQ